MTLADTEPNKKLIPASKAVITKVAQSLLVVYRFCERGVDIYSSLMLKWLLIKGFLQSGWSDGGLVRLTAPILPGRGKQAAREQVEEFEKDMLGSLDPVLP